jgi:uncharacterized alkaline shock family protein YloU
MTEDTANPPSGKTTISPDVLLSVAALTTLDVDGVCRMCSTPGVVNRILQRGQNYEGVKIEVEGPIVNADIHVVLKSEVNVREVSRNIQKEVARAISEMIGMEPGQINIHIEDIDYGEVD